MHGLMESSDGWFANKENSPAFKSLEGGYDVWCINQRGNKYSRLHKTLDPDLDNAFWEFDSREFGLYDVPAAIVFIVEATGR